MTRIVLAILEYLSLEAYTAQCLRSIAVPCLVRKVTRFGYLRQLEMIVTCMSF